jgi:hypothetical protein
MRDTGMVCSGEIEVQLRPAGRPAVTLGMAGARPAADLHSVNDFVEPRPQLPSILIASLGTASMLVFCRFLRLNFLCFESFVLLFQFGVLLR